jgi:hypothetical protein
MKNDAQKKFTPLRWQLKVPYFQLQYEMAQNESFKKISQNGGRADFSKNLRVSLFNRELNEPNFGRIHLDGQYL